mgnify:FL=1
MPVIKLDKTLAGAILDIGGGGESVIGRLYGRQVTAVDKEPEEFDNLPEKCARVVADARKLDFPDGKFDHVTMFYALMYMDEATRREVLAEAARVLRKGGLMHIWDMEFDTYPAKVHLDIVLPGQNLHADYEVHCSGRGVSLEQIRTFGDEAGLLLLMHRDNAGQISLCFQKP